MSANQLFGRILFVLLLLTGLCAKAGSYKIVILGLDSSKSKSLWTNSQQGNQTHYGVGEVMMAAWTNGGALTTRGLIWFDFSQLPAGGVIKSAKLNLYGYDSPSDGGTSNLSGDNSFKVYRATGSWNPKTVAWNNQPGYDTNGVHVAGASSKYNALNIVVTGLVKDMISKGNYGFLVKLNTEQYYRKVVFGSSFNSDSTLRPKLVLEIDVPEADFSSNAPACLGDTLKFTDASVSASNLGYSWNFGDNTAFSTAKNPAHVYAMPGTYKVILKITSTLGAWDTASKYVQVSDRPKASFGLSKPAQCLDGNYFSFFNSTTGTGTITYKWDFGDGTSSTSTSLAHSYTSAGVYKVVLTATNSTGCKDTVSKKVTVSNVSPGFTVSSAKQCLDGNAYRFTNTSTGVGIIYSWDFGDGNTSDSINPLYSYKNPGTYRVLLTVKAGSGCVDTTSIRITVFPAPIALFSVNDRTQCFAGHNFSFSGAGFVSSGNIITWQWDLGDKTSSSAQNPSHTYAAAGTYPVKLTITTDKGCVTTAIDSVRIDPKPTAGFTVNASVQCISSQNFSFTNTSSAGTGTMSYEWDFGDKTGLVSSKNPSYKFAKPGTYTVLLKTLSNGGCIDTISKTIQVLPAPQAVISASGLTKLCTGDHVTLFTNQGTGNTYQWLKDGKKISGSISTSYIASESGNYSVLIDNGAGCTDTSDHITVTVNPVPPQPKITQQGHVLLSAGGVTYKWFLNGSEIPNATLPYYQPTVKKGVYAVMVTDSNGCSSTSEDFIYDISGIKDPAGAKYVKVYPNPAQSVIHIDLGNTESGIRKLEIIGIEGKCVKTIDLKGHATVIEIPVQDYTKGLYLIRFVGDRESFFKKVIVE